MSYANKMKAFRLKQNLTQREVSDVVGWTSSQFVSNIERGICRYPVDKFKALAKIFKVPQKQLIALEVQAHETEVKRFCR